MAHQKDSSKCVENIRNICILAHVDHGKTTIADSLVSVNGHISKRNIGNIRYLDDRKDEQERGITMKTSGISLSYKDVIYNLIDTPGHIDFLTEVSAAIRLCDGALIVVDVVEGVCVQTHEALKQAFDEHVKMILVINKLDRIILEQQKEVDVIFQHILRIIEDCNAYIAELCQYNMNLEIDEDDWLFSPEKGNIVFGSALDGWGITTKQMAEVFVGKFPHETVDSLNLKMWNFDYYAHKGKIVSGGISKGKPNLFISLFLNAIYHIYYTLRLRLDRDSVPKIIDTLKIKNVTAEMKHTDAKVQLKAIMQSWMPLANTILDQIRVVIPSPAKLAKRRYECLVKNHQFLHTPERASRTIEQLSFCGQKDTSTIVYVSKMFAVKKSILRQSGPGHIVPDKDDSKPPPDHHHLTSSEESDGEEHTDDKLSYDKDKDKSGEFLVLGLARIFCGNLRTGQQIYVMSSNYKPPEADDVDLEDFLANNANIRSVKITQLYVLLGREFIAVDSLAAGNICGIRGLEKHIGRTGTLCSDPMLLPFVERQSLEPIVRNSVDCVNPKEIPLLRKGLTLLKKIDSCVQVLMQETGELVLVTAGDVHLAKCIEDIRSVIHDLELNVSKPIVTLKETVMGAAGKRIDFDKPPENLCAYVSDQGLSMSAICVPLPDAILSAITNNYDVLRVLQDNHRKDDESLLQAQTNVLLVAKVRQVLKASFGNLESGPFADFADKIWAVSRQKEHINVLFNNTKDFKANVFDSGEGSEMLKTLNHYIVNGFDICCRAGPICEEPISNCAFIVNVCAVDKGTDSLPNLANIALMAKECLRDSFNKQTPRLMEPIFTTDIQVNTRILGKVYSVLGKRHGRVLEAVGMDEDEKTFMVKAQIPVAESHGFANEIRNTTSGQANPNLRFSHYEVIQGDPYYNFEEAADEEEDEESGVNVDAARRASLLRKEIRKRKGLKVDDQVVVHAEKQRTLNKKK